MSRIRYAIAVFALVSASLAQNREPVAPGDPSQPTANSQEPAKPSAPTATPAVPPDSTGLIAIKTVKAAYPAEAADERVQGEVILKILVSETGDVESAEVVSGHPALANAAVDAVKKWKFKPYIKEGKPVKVSIKLPFDFAFGDRVLLNKISSSDGSKVKDVADASAGLPSRVSVSQGVIQGMVLRKVEPVYPATAKLGRIQGTVVLQAVIGKDGIIKNLHVISGHPLLRQAALDAVQEWRYRPYMLEGQPIEVDTTIQITFSLSGG